MTDSLVVLTTVGSKTGEPRTSPMLYQQDERIPTGSMCSPRSAGRDENPAWFGNLVAHPHDVVVELLGESFLADARVLPEAERAPIFTEQARRQPQFADYQAKTSRVIPVVALDLRR